MIHSTTKFKVKLIEIPEIQDSETKQLSKVGIFTVGKEYQVYAVFDSGAGFTDFLVADDSGVFQWIHFSVFRAK